MKRKCERRENREVWWKSGAGEVAERPRRAQVDERIRMFRTTYSSFRHIWIGCSLSVPLSRCVFRLLAACALFFVVVVVLIFPLQFIRPFIPLCVLVKWTARARALSAFTFPRIWPRSMMCKYMYVHTSKWNGLFSSVCVLPFFYGYFISCVLNVCNAKTWNARRWEQESIDEY